MYYDLFILGSLMERPRYGYEIKKELMEGFTTCTVISNNTLYPILKKFERLGATEKTVEAVEGKPSRIIYSITDAGRALFAQLLQNAPEQQFQSREDFFMRLYYYQYLDRETRLYILDARERFLMPQIEKFRALAKDGPLNDMLLFHLNLLESERSLIEKFRARADEPCLLGTPVQPE